MPEITRTAQITWNGGLETGGGAVTGASGALDALPMTFAARAQQAEGSNPEELLAAAHATCYSMALTFQLEKAGATPKNTFTKASVTFRMNGENLSIPSIHLDCECEVEGIGAEQFQEIAEAVKHGCPVSKLLEPGLESLTLEARLKGA
ncbi:MAG: OsmC family peroxiredoxin [Candidatus Hydrogenedentota bacterium]